MHRTALRLAAYDSFLLFGFTLFAWAVAETMFTLGTMLALPVGVILWGLAKIWQMRVFRLPCSELLRATAVSAGVAVMSFALGAWLWDSSFDGRAYHQEAILRLAFDYHPFKAALTDGGPMGLWVEHYPKAVEIVGAACYRYTGSIEIAKGFSFWFLLSNLFLLAEAIPRLFPALADRRIVRSIAVLAIAANPVVIAQLSTFYVDGLMYSLLVGLVLLARPMMEKAGWRYYPIAFSLVIAVLNLKFTSAVYACMTIGGLCLYRFIQERRWFDHFHLHMGIAVLTGMLWVGFNPYVTNMLSKGHIFYPLFGEGKVDIMTGNSPVGFPELGRFAKFGAAFFGKTENVVPGNEFGGVVHNKIPGLVYPKELTALFAPDCRIGGFGPLASLYMLLSLAFLYRWLRHWRWDVMHGLWLLALISSLSNPEFWWARYAPQLWLVPLFMLIAANPRHAVSSVIHKVALFVLVLDLAIVSVFSLGGATAKTLWMRRQIAILQGVPAERAGVYMDFLAADRAKLEGVAYRVVPPGSLDSLPGLCADFMEYSKVCFEDSVLAERFGKQVKLSDFIKGLIQ